ncbi:MAG TPA: hypothetical protein VK458_00380 [Myxococcaceae bacterium]|nr:hypothetical protein [Myxococcaceae bacterium]
MSSPPENEATAIALLHAARRLIRGRTRAPAYWAAADRLSTLWLGVPLRSTSEFLLAAGPDLAASLDSLYEKAMLAEDALEALPGLTRRLQELLEPEAASRVLKRYEAGLPEVDLLEATRVLLATLTTQGYAALHTRGSPRLASRWLAAWAEAVGAHDLQQQRVCGLGLLARLPPEDQRPALARLGLTSEALIPRGTSFSEGVTEYLEHYGDTGAASMAVLGTLAFSTLPAEEVEALLELCVGEAGLLRHLSGLFRLAQDVSFDPTEPLNAGVFASAAEQRRSVLEIISDGKFSKPELDARLREAWTLQSTRTRGALEALLASRGQGLGAATLATWLQALFQVLAKLVPGTWKTE